MATVRRSRWGSPRRRRSGCTSRSDVELDDVSVRLARPERQPRDRDRQAEPAGSRAPGVDQQHAAASLDVWPMGVAGDDDVDLLGLEIESELVQVVDDADTEPG